MRAAPSGVDVSTVVAALTRERLFDLARVFGARLRQGRETKAALAQQLSGFLGDERLAEVLRELGRDELRAVCRAHDLPADERTREALIARLAEAAGVNAAKPASPPPRTDALPQPGAVLTARGRQWLVEKIDPGNGASSPLLRLACLDDDAPGRRLELLWNLELGARVVDPEAEGLGRPQSLDPPVHFGAYLHALKWSTVSAADATRFQAPFRAGIKLMPHQLTPLMKALELPRANLFIADDVGLGKTIEAGLVLQELILRQQAAFVLIVCPASICLQWRDEMMRRFGLRFEVMSRQLVARRRVERGFGVNPWATHNRFVVSHNLIRRPEYRDPLLAHLGHRAEKGLLILDEAHVAAPATASKYAVDTQTTATVRDLAPKFDNRLFLSATPHNGHSNSFSALLEILDPVRFTRGVPIRGAQDLAPVMVRRLKRDLRQLGSVAGHFPERVLARIELAHGGGGWSARQQRYSVEAQREEAPTTLAEDLGGENTELELSELLARYTELRAPGRGRGRLVFINLQKRLLSSPEAFARTLEVHARNLGKADAEPKHTERQLSLVETETDAETYGETDEARDAEDDALVADATQALDPAPEDAAEILKRMRALAERARRQPDAKALALLAWLRAHACPAIGRASDASVSTAWTDRRVILFTEFGDTKRYLQEILASAIAHTDRGDERILVYHGGMGDDARDAVQRAFNAPPADHPARILVATDAAREGVNLQAHCADLFHVDVPWNPSRLEQRNGRIDRTLQPADEVRCHYFVFPQRAEDRVLDTLVKKLERIKRELGSVGAVLMDDMERALEDGITAESGSRLDAIGTHTRSRMAEQELEAQRKDLDALLADVQRAGLRLDSSRRALEVEPETLRGVVEIGLRLAGAEGLQAGGTTSDGRPTYRLPELDRSWQPTLDSLRPPRGRTEAFWEWRRRPPRDVTFTPLQTLTEEAEQLHLAHPLVRRILDRFLAQGFGAHDLSRVCVAPVPSQSVSRAIALARLSLFGRGAARLHDELIAVVAPWPPTEGNQVAPYRDAATAAKALADCERAMAADASVPRGRLAERALDEAPAIFAALWPHLHAEADARATEAANGLARRARKEGEDLRALLERQRTAIAEARHDLKQLVLPELADKDQRRQAELDLEHMARREERIAQELESEPAAIEALYEVRIRRLTPVGLAVAVPGTA